MLPVKFWPDLKPVIRIFWKCRTFNSGHFNKVSKGAKISDGLMVMNFYSCLFKHWYQIDQHQLTCTRPLKILKFQKHITPH